MPAVVRVTKTNVLETKRKSKYGIFETLDKEMLSKQYKMWNLPNEATPADYTGKTFEVVFKEEEFKGTPQFIITQMTESPVPIEFPQIEPRPSLRKDYEDIRDKYLGRSTKYFKVFNEMLLGTHWDLFSGGSAASGNHHVGVGQLAEHTLGVIRLGIHLVETYKEDLPWLDLEMVVTGCALHDFGKIYDYEVDTETNAVEYIPHIALINHLPRGAMEVHAFAVANDLDLTELEHCILAHHQRMDWGSPTTPATAEAFIVALSDYVDGTVAGIGARIKELMEAGQDMGRIRMGTLSTVVSPKTRELDGLI